MKSTVEFHGIELIVEAFKNGVLSVSQVQHLYEDNEMVIIEHLVTKEDRVIDFGGGTGWTSLQLALCRGSGDGIFTYEPNPTFAITLQNGIRYNGQPMEMFYGAVVHDDRRFAKYLMTNNPFFNRISFSDDDEIMAQSDIRVSSTITVPCHNINQIIREHQANCLVIDIEGYEWELLKHIDYTPITKLIVEFHLAYTQDTVEMWIRKLKSMGFDMIDYSTGKAVGPMAVVSFRKL